MAATFRHNQVTPATTWTVTHNLGAMPAADIILKNGDIYEKAFPLSMTYPDLNTVVIAWSSPQSGQVVLASSEV